jgi:hypothetical protein
MAVLILGKYPKSKIIKYLSRLIVNSETGTFKPVSVDWGRERTIRTSDVENRVLDHILGMQTSTRDKRGRDKYFAHDHLESTARTDALVLSFTMRAMSRACWIPSMRHLFFVCSTKFWAFLCFFSARYVGGTSRADGIINFHNHHQWVEDNPHAAIHSTHQQQFRINVWTGIVGDCLLGSHVLPHNFPGNNYGDFLLHNLPKLLEGVPLAVSSQMCYVPGTF